jgi:hypothetical protein
MSFFIGLQRNKLIVLELLKVYYLIVKVDGRQIVVLRMVVDFKWR